MNTRSQKLAQQAYQCVSNRHGDAKFGEYGTLARKFPALIHTCGLAQAVSFVEAKRNNNQRDGGPHGQFLADFAAVLHAGGHKEVTGAARLAEHSRSDPLIAYLRLSRDAIDAAAWLKRYAEALGGATATEQEDVS